jgi:dTDP-4-dehydrorhamnose reductase
MSEAVELWVGVEGTVNRVGDRFFDQLARSGHLRRADDVDLIPGLGVTTARYPFLWEHVDVDGWPTNWNFADERAARLRSLGVRPIAGLLHHGSGPRGTSLVDAAFPRRFAQYARAFAERFPWIEDYTPINEPLTTARFSGLYGWWFPHARDDVVYLRALLHQLEATVLAMREIRRVNPRARLLQTEDLGWTTSSPGLEEQAAFHNHHRWLTFDLLCGRVTPAHPLYDWLVAVGRVSARALAFFVEHPCAPDVIGINHYLTSDRFLDLELARHPRSSWGGNGRQRYADVEAVAVHPVRGHAALLREAWERYRIPVALSEVHLGGDPLDQLRWLHEAWTAAAKTKAEGVAVVAVVVWALLGSFDWDCLVTAERGHYEPGPFDVRGLSPRATPLAHMTRELALTGRCDHPALQTPGWWRRRFMSSARMKINKCVNE